MFVRLLPGAGVGAYRSRQSGDRGFAVNRRRGFGDLAPKTLPSYGEVPWYCVFEYPAAWVMGPSPACTPAPTMTTPPIIRTPPAAPQTQHQLEQPGHWTPEDSQVWTAEEVRARQEEQELVRRAEVAGEIPPGAPPPGGDDNTVLWVVGGIAGVALLLVLVKR